MRDPEGSIFLSEAKPSVDELSLAFLSLKYDPSEILDLLYACHPEKYFKVSDNWRFGILQSRDGTGVTEDPSLDAQGAHYQAILDRDV